jgi:fructosamine-3-kinase
VDGGTAFVKTRADAGSGEYEAEAKGLAWLAKPGALRTPRVLEVGATTSRWSGSSPVAWTPRAQRSLGADLL